MTSRFSSMIVYMSIELTYLQALFSHALPVPEYITESITVSVDTTTFLQQDTTITATDCNSTHTRFPGITPVTALRVAASDFYGKLEPPPGLAYHLPKPASPGSVDEPAAQIEAQTVVLETEVPGSAGGPDYGLPYYGPITTPVIWSSLPIQSVSVSVEPGTTGVSRQISPCVATSKNWSTHAYVAVTSRYIPHLIPRSLCLSRLRLLLHQLRHSAPYPLQDSPLPKY